MIAPSHTETVNIQSKNLDCPADGLGTYLAPIASVLIGIHRAIWKYLDDGGQRR